MRLSISTIIFLFIANSAYSNDLPLPNWIDHSRETIQVESRIKERANYAPPTEFRLPAEYEEAQAVVLGWQGYTSMLRDITKAVTKYGNAEVWAVGGPSSISGADMDKYKTYGCSLNTVWMRDYGPFGITETGDLAIVDSVYRHWQYRRYDDRLPECLAGKKNVENFKMDLVLDGGNLMVDSKGNLFTTNRTYIWNNDKSEQEVNELLKAYYNVEKIHVIEYAGYPGSPADGTGHIDMFVKLLNDETVLIAKTNASAFKGATEKAVKYFESIKTPSGKPYKIIRVKAWVRYGTWYTYTNSLIVNNTVLMPTYRSDSSYTQTAIDAYEQGMPGVKVIPINSDSSIGAGGSIHCVTQLVPSTK